MRDTAFLDALARVSGLSASKIEELHQASRANWETLHRCERHDFEKPTKLGERVHCKNCGGTTSRQAAHFYEQGLEHGAKR